ncbi:MAG: PEP-CTERM system histidine kinase PrsK [Sphingomonadales bacterium]|nr:PEP-CTERM system histidine kinase PrsK [Sphingomonadales bacterium]
MIAVRVAGLWGEIAVVAHVAGACAAAGGAGWLFARRGHVGAAHHAVATALACMALWCLAVAIEGSPGTGAALALALALRNLALLFALHRLFASDGRAVSVAPVRPVLLALALVALLLPAAQIVETPALANANTLRLPIASMLAMLFAVGALVLVHNLYAGAVPQLRGVLHRPALALALVWGYDLNLYTAAALGRDWPVELDALRGFVVVAFAGLLAFGAGRGREELRFQPSRTVAFQSVSLLLIGAYLLAMVGVAQWLSFAGGGFARWLQVGFLIVACTAALLTLPSRRARGWLRVTLAKHFFQHRYDYRAEWLRFTRTIGQGRGEDGVAPGENSAAPLHQRVIQALADITASPAGLLLTLDDYGDLAFCARWHWATAQVPSPALPRVVAGHLEQHSFIVDLDAMRAGKPESCPTMPEWLLAEADAWAVVPLLHFDRLIGVVVLARPPEPRGLDWEDFDLLRIAGQQTASYLAEHQGQQALIEAARFDDFHRRIAFVMHDIKNLASQFTLLARNAERHADNPAFRGDMLLTLRNSAEKLNTLMARLSRHRAGTGDAAGPVALGPVIRDIAAQFAARHPVTAIERQECEVCGHRDAIEQMLLHLVQNAVDASGPQSPVLITLTTDGLSCLVEVADAGSGMSAEFLRHRLFRPFDSSKNGGFGIGAYEARELARAMGGRIDVESREGLGSRFTVRLPLAGATRVRHSLDAGKRVA